MAPDQDDLDAEIRGHMALSVKERLERGDDPETARLTALKEFGNVTLTRDSMQRVWRPRWADGAESLWRDLRFAFRSLRRARGLSAAVVTTLALGIGANAAIFSVVREVLLRPLVNRDADRLIYIRQHAPGLGAGNLTFSVPELRDLQAKVTTLHAFGDFSTIDFTLVGIGEPRVVRAGVVGGSFFEVMGLRPVLGRLLGPADDGPSAAPAAVLTYRFWSTSLQRDPNVIGRTVRLDVRDATIVGVLEPSVPYPAETEIIANVVTSPHHLEATMVTGRTHRMTELFGRLAPGVTLDAARAEIATVHAGMMRAHPEAYPVAANVQVGVARLRDQIAGPARTILLVLLAAAGLVFVIACANVANLILARTVRRESELVVRAALGASAGALRRTLLAESLVLCGAGAGLGLLLASPLVGTVGRFASRFSIRALDVTVDASLMWVGAGLAMAAAVALAYVPRLPSPQAPTGPVRAGHGPRITAGAGRRLRAFAVTQIALSFVLVAGAGMVVSTLVALQQTRTGYEMHRVLALDVPQTLTILGPTAIAFYEEATRRIEMLPGVRRVSAGSNVPWRDADQLGPGRTFAVEGGSVTDAAEQPHALMRNITPGFFAALGVPLVAGRDFTDADRAGAEPVAIVSESLARRAFGRGEALDRALNRNVWWTDRVFGRPLPRRIVGIVVDVDDVHVVPEPTLTIYHPFRQVPFAGRLFVHTTGDPYALVTPITRVIRELAPDQPVERAATLADVRAEVLAPDRLNAFVLAGFAGVALLIAVVGVAGMLAFSVSARMGEFGIRLALGSTRRRLLGQVLSEAALIATGGVVAGVGVGYLLARVAASQLDVMRLPGLLPALSAAAAILAAAVIAALLPAARASRVDVVQALRSE